jgi:DNA polymerase
MIVAMYHPAAALHQPALRATVEGDFARLPEFILKAKEHQQNDKPDRSSPEQLELF